MSSRRLVLASVLAIGCGAEAPVPDKPTWADDVQPILRANCFHCHGATADLSKAGTIRWDVLDLTDSALAALGFQETGAFTSARNSVHLAVMLGFIGSPDETKRMPPPPATRLSDRDFAVLTNWMGTERVPGAHRPNHKPTIVWTIKPTQYQVLDADGDQVLGKLDCGGMEVTVLRTGGGLALPDGVTPPCTGTLFDGFQEASVSLK
jgi:hypothetical protein